MPRTRSKTARPADNFPVIATGTAAPSESRDVLTLPEAAAYLRISEADVLGLVHAQALPGRDIGDGWRFLKAALQNWLSAAPGKKGLLSQLGAIKDDPHAEEMLGEIYKRRGRPETEEG